MHKKLNVFLDSDDIKRVQTVCDTKKLTPSQAMSKLVRAGFEVVMKKSDTP